MILTGVIERIIFKNIDNGYTVLEAEVSDKTVTMVGIMPLVAAGEQIEVEGAYIVHKSFGEQFVVTSFSSRLPVAETAILRYLSSGIVKGVGAKTAKLLVDRFGPETLEVIENDSDRLTELKGMSKKRADAISKSMCDTLGIKSILLYFQQFGITPSSAFKMYKQWGAKAYDVVRANPYRICEISGLGFETADEIARKMDYDEHSENRIQAGIIYVLNFNLYSGGHTFLPKEKLCASATNLLGIDEDEIVKSVDVLITDKVLVYIERIANTDAVYLREIFESENSVIERLRLCSKLKKPTFPNVNAEIANIEKKLGIQYASRQKMAIRAACENNIMILTGGPGTGKTTTLNGILRAFESQHISFALAAPTGRAAKRITELTGREAKTLHRLLEYKPDGADYVFNRNRNNLLEYDAVVVDEASMVDLNLFTHLLDAMPIKSRLIMVGDAAQLPPVGPGRVFKDVLESLSVVVVELTEIFRQARESLIVTNAHMILKGDMPDLTRRDKDFFFLPTETYSEMGTLVCDLYEKRLPTAYGYNAMSDIQVLSPTRKGVTGTVTLNEMLKARINPPEKSKFELTFRGVVFREGDKVMQIKNDYDIVGERRTGETEPGVFNGDIGIVEKVLPHENSVAVRYDDRLVTYTPETLDEIEPAYAITVHKSQGSEFPVVILTLDEGYDVLFTRNLLYTAVTRARKLLIIVGKQRRIAQMVKNVRSDKRYSGLKYRIVYAMEEDKDFVVHVPDTAQSLLASDYK